MNEPYGESLADKFVEKYGDKIIKDTLNSYKKEIKQLKQDKELLLSDYEWLLKDKRELEKENKELKAQIAEYDDLTEELDYRKREAKRLGWNSKESASTITKIIDGPITYTKDSTGKWVADGKPPIVLC